MMLPGIGHNGAPSVDLVAHDFESSSEENIKLGAYKYMTHPSTRLIMLRWRPNKTGDVRIWWANQDFDEELRWYVNNGAIFTGWNVQFEYYAWNVCGVKYHNFPPLPRERFVDTAWRSVAANLPRSLAGASIAVGASTKKDEDGHKLMLELTNATKTPYAWLWKGHYRQRMIKFASYCGDDVMAEESTGDNTPDPPTVYPWADMPRVDAAINDRGILCDVALVRGMRIAAAKETVLLNDRMKQITNGRVPEISKLEELKVYLLQAGVKLPTIEEIKKKAPEEDVPEDFDATDSEIELEQKLRYRLRKNDVTDLLLADLPGDYKDDDGVLRGTVREVLELRRDAAKISVKKLDAMERAAGDDHRLRGALILGGAQQTLRWSGAVWQPHNFIRRTIANGDDVEAHVVKHLGEEKFDKKNSYHRQLVDHFGNELLREAVEYGQSGDNNLIRGRYGAVLEFVSRMLRRTLTAAEEHTLLQADYAQIEARINAWFCGHWDLVETFRSGKDVYRFTAAPIFNKTPETVTKEERQIGKVSFLGLGYLGGVGVFIVMAMVYGMRMTREESLPIVYAWRESNKPIMKCGYELLNTVLQALANPGREYSVAPLHIVTYCYRDGALHCRLPSGRFLRYWSPRIEKPDDLGRPVITFWSTRGKAGFRKNIWAGLLLENIVQAIAADMLAGALEMVSRYNFPIVLHVHDSIAAEVPVRRAMELLPLFEELIGITPQWTKPNHLDRRTWLPVGVDAHASARFG